MLKDSPKRLLVEGMADQAFYDACCRFAKLNQVWIGPPSDFQGVGTGKGNAIKILPDLIDEMGDERVTHLAIVVDADYFESDGLGFKDTWKKITDILEAKQYDIRSQKITNTSGYIFKNKNSLPDVGLWIMPNNKDGGFLENFIKQSLAANEKKLFSHAEFTVNKLQDVRFKPIHVSKAEVSTWLAWQKVPGQVLASAVSDSLIDLNSGVAKEFITWLKKIFK